MSYGQIQIFQDEIFYPNSKYNFWRIIDDVKKSYNIENWLNGHILKKFGSILTAGICSYFAVNWNNGHVIMKAKKGFEFFEKTKKVLYSGCDMMSFLGILKKLFE